MHVVEGDVFLIGFNVIRHCVEYNLWILLVVMQS